MPDRSTDAAHADEHDPVRPQEAVIEANGSEFLVTINGAVFVALSVDAAKAFAQRMRATPVRCDGERRPSGTRHTQRIASA